MGLNRNMGGMHLSLGGVFSTGRVGSCGAAVGAEVVGDWA